MVKSIFTSPVLVSEYINVTGKQPVATKTVAPYTFAVHTNKKRIRMHWPMTL
ncbi:hypothetical protein QW180_17430 [Vibrio sinaloensis]|nr:hypothetical protein [Vibrio sinaloensis]